MAIWLPGEQAVGRRQGSDPPSELSFSNEILSHTYLDYYFTSQTSMLGKLWDFGRDFQL